MSYVFLMTVPYLDQKRAEYTDVGPAPELTDLDSYENRIYGLKKAISLALQPIVGKKKSIVDLIQRQVLDVLEAELLATQKDPIYVRLLEEKNQVLLEAEQAKNDEINRQLYEKTIANAKKTISDTPLTACIEDIDVEAFDLFYKNRYLNAISTTGNVTYPGKTKNPKKIIVKNIDTLKNKDFIKTLVAPKNGEGLILGQYNRELERGCILGTIYVGGSINSYFVLHFNDSEEGIYDVRGDVELKPFSPYTKLDIKTDLEIQHPSYIDYKKKKYNYK